MPHSISLRERVIETLAYAFVMVTLVFDFGRFSSNEVNKLAAAKRHVVPDWLTNDWYLGLEKARYDAFNRIAGPLVDYFGFVDAAIIGRLICYVALGYAFHRLRVGLGLGWHWMMGVLVIFLINQGFVAGAWMAGGVEAKTLAYAALLLAIAAYSRSAPLFGAAWVGVAVSLHPLIGAYGAMSVAFAILLTTPLDWSQWRKIITSQWPFVFTGLVGITAIVGQLSGSNGGVGGNAQEAARIYVHFRNPHHTLPDVWPSLWVWGPVLLFGILSSSLIVVAARVGRIRFLAAFVAGTTMFFLFGLVAWQAGQTQVLQYYPFRLADTFVPLWISILLFWLLARRRALIRLLVRRFGKTGLRVGALSTALAVVAFFAFVAMELAPNLRDRATTLYKVALQSPFHPRTFTTPSMFEWVATHVPDDAVMLVPPSLSTVYLHMGRAAVATFKHAPHSPEGTLQWYARMLDLGGGRIPQGKGKRAVRELDDGYYGLQTSDVTAIKLKYGATHMLTNRTTTHRFLRLHEDKDWVLYDLCCEQTEVD